MAEVVLSVAASLDGFVARPDGSVDWLEAFQDDADGDVGTAFESFFETVDCLVMGSRTYEQVVTEFVGDDPANWPYGETPTYVATHRDLPRATEHVRFVAGDLGDIVATLESEHETIWLVGGAALAQAFVREGLLDAIRLSVVPLLLGAGIPLFGETGVQRALRLEDVTAFESGVVELRYAAADGRS